MTKLHTFRFRPAPFRGAMMGADWYRWFHHRLISRRTFSAQEVHAQVIRDTAWILRNPPSPAATGCGAGLNLPDVSLNRELLLSCSAVGKKAIGFSARPAYQRGAGYQQGCHRID